MSENASQVVVAIAQKMVKPSSEVLSVEVSVRGWVASEKAMVRLTPTCSASVKAACTSQRSYRD